MPARPCDLLPPPSVYDFREASILYGPVSDMVPSSVVFELYPIASDRGSWASTCTGCPMPTVLAALAA